MTILVRGLSAIRVVSFPEHWQASVDFYTRTLGLALELVDTEARAPVFVLEPVRLVLDGQRAHAGRASTELVDNERGDE